MIGDMMTTGFHGAEMANVGLGSTVAVFGIGPVGLMAVAGAHLLGAARILAVGSRPNAVTVAKEYGATEIIDYHNGDTVRQIMDLTDGAGVDAAITAGGGVETIGQAVEVLQPGGRARMERLAALVKAGRIDPGRLITHRFTNFEDIEEALLLMHEKPKNLIKPAVILE